MKLWRAARASWCLVLLAGCNGSRDAADSAQSWRTGGPMVQVPDLGGPELLAQSGGDAGTTAKAGPASTRPPRPTNAALLAQRAKLQSLRGTTILGRSRALMHHPEFDQLKRAVRGLPPIPPKAGTPTPAKD